MGHPVYCLQKKLITMDPV